MSYKSACARRASEYERECMKNEPHPEEWLRRHREIIHDRIVESVGGAVLVLMVIAMFALWLKAEGVI